MGWLNSVTLAVVLGFVTAERCHGAVPASAFTINYEMQLVSGTVWNEDKQAGIIVLASPATSGTPSLNNVIVLKTSSILVRIIINRNRYRLFTL